MSTIANINNHQSNRSENFENKEKRLFKVSLAQKSDNFHNGLLVALAKAGAIKIKRYLTRVGRGKVFWAHYQVLREKQEPHSFHPIARGISSKLKKTFSSQTKASDWIINSIGSTYQDLLAAYLEANPEVKSFVTSHQGSQKPNRPNSRMRYQRKYSNDLAASVAFANAFGGF